MEFWDGQSFVLMTCVLRECLCCLLSPVLLLSHQICTDCLLGLCFAIPSGGQTCAAEGSVQGVVTKAINTPPPCSSNLCSPEISCYTLALVIIVLSSQEMTGRRLDLCTLHYNMLIETANLIVYKSHL